MAVARNISPLVRSMEEEDWPLVRRYLAAELSAHHPVLDETLFFWQYRGFGPLAGIQECQLAFVGDDLCGFRGVIPGLYEVPTLSGERSVAPGGSGAVWTVAPRARGQGVGRALWIATESRLPVRTSLGARFDTAVPFYQRSGFMGVDGLHHWYVALEPQGFLDLSFGDWREDELRQWCESISSPASIAPTSISCDELGRCWASFVKQTSRVFALHRNAEFWQWRYLEHPHFRYLTFGGFDAPAVVVARVERVRTPTTRYQVLRMIELVPMDELAWTGSTSTRVVEFLTGILAWARSIGCVAADFRNVSSRLDPTLRRSGFAVNRQELAGAEGRGLAGLLTPFRPGTKPINAHWKVDERLKPARITPDDVYMVKSDSDMDRPNDPIPTLERQPTTERRR